MTSAKQDDEISDWEAEIMLDREGRYAHEVVIDCTSCRHRTSQGALTCQAFPNGILVGILMGQLTHRIPIEGDNGIQFSPLA